MFDNSSLVQGEGFYSHKFRFHDVTRYENAYRVDDVL